MIGSETKHMEPGDWSTSAPTVRLGDFCELHLGARFSRNPVSDLRSGRGGSLADVRLIRARDLFTEAPFGERVASIELQHPRQMDQARVRRGDILLPAVARRLRARIVDSDEIDGCIADHTVVILRPRPGAPSTSQLANYFSSATFLEAVQRYASGTIIGALRLTPKALAEMPFMVPVDPGPSDSVVDLMDRVVRDIIRVIARNSAELQKVEWRVLEQVLAAAFEDFGFDVHLTPAAKDGGKDMILECVERGTRRRYVVEVKHWVSGKPVHGLHLRKFLQVIVKEQHDSGLLLSTSGFARNACESLIHLEHKRIRMAGRDKILSLCQLFVMRESGLWKTEQLPTDILFEQTDETIT